MCLVYRRTCLVIIGLIFSMILVRGGSVVFADQPKIEVGEPFPNIVFPALEDGRARSIADFRGHKLILHVFASW